MTITLAVDTGEGSDNDDDHRPANPINLRTAICDNGDRIDMLVVAPKPSQPWLRPQC